MEDEGAGVVELEQPHRRVDLRADSSNIERLLDITGVRTPRLLHGKETTTWSVLRAVLACGNDIRVGLEDTLLLPDVSIACYNAHLVTVAVAYRGVSNDGASVCRQM